MAIDFPSSPTSGQQFQGYTYNSTIGAWQANSAAVAPSTVSANPPANPTVGDMWFNTNDGSQYFYYNDGNTSQWVESRAPITANGYYSPNYIINGAFDIWQRGTSISPGLGYTADRWLSISSPTMTVTRAIVAPGSGSIPQSINYCADITGSSVGSAGYSYFDQRIEDCQTIAGKTVTISFWGKGSVAGNIAVTAGLDFGSGGSAGVGALGSTIGLTTSWQRFSVTLNMPSASGKTIGANSFASLRFVRGLGTNYVPSQFNIPALVDYTGTMSITGVQLEEGSVATTFRRNANSLQGELAACQRYYYRAVARGANAPFAIGQMQTTTVARYHFSLPVPMRAIPTALDYSGPFQENALSLADSLYTISGLSIESNWYSDKIVYLVANNTGGTAGKVTNLSSYNSASAYIGISSEL